MILPVTTASDNSRANSSAREIAGGDKLTTLKGEIEITDRGIVFLSFLKKRQDKIEYLVEHDPSGDLESLQGHIILATGYFSNGKADIRYYISIKPWGGQEINPTEMVTVGIVRQLGFSIYMEGTHILEDEAGELLCLLESRTITWDDFLNKRVKLKGKYSRTIEGEQIIIQVDNIQVVP